MKKLKKYLTCLVLIFAIFLFTGCASIQYERSVRPDGKIVEMVLVKLDEEKINQVGKTKSEVINFVINKMNIYSSNMVNNFFLKEDTLLYIEKVAVTNNILFIADYDEANDVVFAKMEFKNYNTFRYFYGLHLEEESVDDSEIIENYLYNKKLSKTQTVFAVANDEFIESEFSEEFNNEFTIEDCNLSFVFGSPDNKLHSDADYTYIKDGVKYHQWNLNSIEDEISTFTFMVKPVNWYILSLVLTLALIIILFVVSLFVKGKKENPIEYTIENYEDFAPME